MVGLPVIPVVISSLVFAVFATGLGVYNHKQFAAGVDINDKIEIVRGAALGVALSVGFFF
jgi:hypothetical protein